MLSKNPITIQRPAANKALHSDKIKLRSFLTTLYFAGELGRYTVKKLVLKKSYSMQYDFEWDPRKAKTNLSKHCISFERAATVFRDLKWTP